MVEMAASKCMMRKFSALSLTHVWRSYVYVGRVWGAGANLDVWEGLAPACPPPLSSLLVLPSEKIQKYCLITVKNRNAL